MSRWRHFTIVAGFLAACAALGARIVYLTVLDAERLSDEGADRAVRQVAIPAYRGVVLDRHGEPLALSTPVAAVWTDPSRSPLSAEELVELAAALDLDAKALTAKLVAARGREFVYLKRRVSWEQWQRVQQLGIKGVAFEREYKRYYPAGETAAHVVGLTDVDDRGIEGIELSFDEHLAGAAGRKTVLKDLRGNVVRNLEFDSAPRYGEDLALSIDLRLQFLAYRELKAAVESHRAKSGSMVLLDVATGEILALVNQPSYNPNNGADRAPKGMRNRAVTDLYEPGSTIKPISALAALDSGLYEPDTIIETSPGFYRVGDKLVQDPVSYGAISLERALQKSSQVAFTKVALSLEERAIYDKLMLAGLGDYPGTGMPGEVAGMLSDAGLRYPVVRAVLSYGYGLAVTPLQLAQAYLVLASGGVRLPVSILRQSQPPAGERVFDEAEVWEVLSMMEGVTDRAGTAPKARIPGFRVAGKTGTARKVGREGYDDERHAAWFAGIAPASRPRLVGVVLINEPQGVARGGGDVAAPVYGRVVSRALRQLGVSPDETAAD